MPEPMVSASTIFDGKSVALVGNGPGVVGSGLGPRIDSFGVVVRFNEYRTEGFEADVGTRTDAWASHFKGMKPRPDAPALRICSHENSAIPEGCEAIRIPMAFFTQMRKEVQRRRAKADPFTDPQPLLPTSGLVVASWIVRNASPAQLALAGFDHFSKEKSKQHHYWDSRAFGQPREHAPDVEAELFGEMVLAGKIEYMEAEK